MRFFYPNLNGRRLLSVLLLSFVFGVSDSFAQCVELIGKGTAGSSTVTLNISTPLADIDHIEVEATYKSSSAFPTSIKFETSSQSISQGTADTIQPWSKCSSQQVGFYRASMNPASSVTLKVLNNPTAMWSFIAYVVKKPGACGGTVSSIGSARHYIYQCTKEMTYNIPATANNKNIKVQVPLTEMTNDSRVAIITVTAGTQSVSKTVNTYDLGASLTIPTLELNEVPGTVTSVKIKLESPTSNGDSYLNNATVLSYTEANCDPGKKCVEIIGKGAACNTYTTLNFGQSSCSENVATDFSGSSASDNDGSIDFDGDWILSGSYTAITLNRLRVSGLEGKAYRYFDQPSINIDTVYVNFKMAQKGFSGAEDVELMYYDGTCWYTLTTINCSQMPVNNQFYNFSLSSVTYPNLLNIHGIKFKEGPNGFMNDQGDSLWVDDVDIRFKSANCLSTGIPLSEIDHIEVEAIYKGYQPSGVNFITSSQNIYKSSSAALPLTNYNNLCYKGIFRATLNPDTIVKLKVNSNTCYMQSFVAYVYRKAEFCGSYNQNVDYSKNYYVTDCDKSITTSIPSTSTPKTIEVNIPVNEKNDVSYTAVFTLTAGSQTVSKSVQTYNLGKSLSIVHLKLENVPGNVTSYTVNLSSAGGACGDSYVNGSILSTWSNPCSNNDTSDFCGAKKITINCSKVSGCDNFENFPVLIDISSNSFKANSDLRNPNGWDIMFTNANGEPLPFQIESYNSTTGNFKVWVNVDVLKYSSNTILYMYYGNAAITQDPSSGETFSECYQGVYHFENTNDGTVNENHGTNYGSTSVAGKIGNGRYFDGIDDYISVANSTGLNITGKTITLSTWVKAVVPNDEDAPFINKGTAENSEQYMLGIDGDVTSNNINTRVTTNTGHYRHDQGTINNNTWHYVSFVYDGNLGSAQKKTYVNGNLVASQTASGNLISTAADVLIGKRLGSARYFKGTLDELRVSCSALSADWIKTEYNNQNSPSTFYTVTDAKICSPVPVTLVKFDARIVEENQVMVNWMTAMELNNDYFEVERKTDVQEQIEKVAKVKGNGTTNQVISYAVMDDIAQVKGEVIYYRLRQVDFDGTITYSDWVPVNRNAKFSVPVIVYPTPSQDYVNVTVEGNKRIIVDELMVMSIEGRDVTSSIQYFVEGNTILMETSKLPNGVYILQAEGSMGTVRQSLLIRK